MRSNERSALKTVKGSTSQERRVKTRFSLPRTQSAVLDQGRSWISVTTGIHQQITIIAEIRAFASWIPVSTSALNCRNDH